MPLGTSDRILCDECLIKLNDKNYEQKTALIWNWIKQGKINLKIFSSLLIELMGEHQ